MAKTEEQKLVNPSTFSEIAIFYYGRFADLLWDDFHHYNTIEDIWDGIWMCQKAEEQLRNIHLDETVKNLDEFTMFESYGFTFDMYCYGTWDMLRKFPKILSTLSEEIKEFTMIEKDKVRYCIPPLKQPPDDWIMPIKKNSETNIVGLLLALNLNKKS